MTLRFAALAMVLLGCTAPTSSPSPVTNNDGHACTSAAFSGAPGALWVDEGDGTFAVFDTMNGALLKTVKGPGPMLSVAGANGTLWLTNVNNDRKITPMLPSGVALPALDVRPDNTPVAYEDTLFAYATQDANAPSTDMTLFAITSPTSRRSSKVAYVGDGASAVSKDGFFFLGGPSASPTTPTLVAVDPATLTVSFTVTLADQPALAGYPLTIGAPKLVAVPGKVILLLADSPNGALLAVDTTTHAVTTGQLGSESVAEIMTDGAQVFAFDTSSETVYEIDPSTLATKRAQKIPGTVALSGLVAAGGVWFQSHCGGETYVRRVDTQTLAVSDLLVPSKKNSSAHSLAFLK